MIRRCIILVTIAGLLLSGCKASTNERVFLRSGADGGYAVRVAPYDGEYRLYADVAKDGRGKPTTQSFTPIRSQRLSRGERIGFLRDDSGRLVGVIWDERIAPETALPCVWTVQPDAGQTDWEKTAFLVVAVAAGVGIGVAIAVGSSAPSSGSFTVITLQ